MADFGGGDESRANVHTRMCQCFSNSFKTSYRNLNVCDNKSRYYDRIRKGRARKVEGEALKLVRFFKVGV